MAHYRSLFDHEFQFLKEVAVLVDRHLDRLDLDAARVQDPDMTGEADRAEHVVGLGFAAIQQYINSFRKNCPAALLHHGPEHRTGVPMVKAVNAAANYWKHAAEWRKPFSDRALRTRETLSALGVNVDSDYVLSNALAALLAPLPMRFERFLPFLEAWRHDALAHTDTR